MKNLIVTLGAMIYVVTLIYFQIDLNGAFQYKNLLKAAADEAAATGALFTDFNSYAEGNQVFDYEKSIEEARASIDYNLKSKDYEFTMTFQDDSGYTREFNKDGQLITYKLLNKVVSPNISIKLVGKKPKFRLNFIDFKEHIRVDSCYEYMPY